MERPLKQALSPVKLRDAHSKRKLNSQKADYTRISDPAVAAAA
jgi:hypothetical protein